MTNCSGSNCNKPAKLQCPTCKSFGISNSSYFCSQDCFKENWSSHKALHPSSQTIFPGFKYSGALRAYPLSQKLPVPERIIRPEYADSGFPESEDSVKKNNKIIPLTAKEIQGMRKVCKLAREVLDIAEKAARPGVTTDEIDRIVHEACIERDSYPSPLNYHGFPKSCCTSVNEVICHGIPDMRPLRDGEIINIDVTLYHDGFHGDLNETYLVGNVDENGRKLVANARKCLDHAIAIVRPGTLYRDVGEVITEVASEEGFSVVRTYCGHGIGRVFHGPPTIPHHSNNRAVGTMKAGHVFTIEPMINEGVWQDIHWPDNWTAATQDGKRSAQFEHTLLVTDTGCEILTAK